MDLLVAWMFASQMLGSVSAGGFAVLAALAVGIGGPIFLLVALDRWRRRRKQ